MDGINILVIGTGAYSIGRGTSGFGTILPAIFEWKRSGAAIDRVIFVSSDGVNTAIVKEKCRRLSLETGVKLTVDAYPKQGERNTVEYQDQLDRLARPACVIVAVPDHLHYGIVKECLLRDFPVLVVKPFTPLVSEGRELVQLAQLRNLYGAVEFHKRWDKSNIVIKDAISQGNLGELLYCWVEYSQRKSIPTTTFKSWSFRSSILQYLGVHYIDIVLFYTNAMPLRVMATGQKNWLYEQGIDTWDSIQCTVEWLMPSGSKFVQTLLTNWIDPETTSAMSDQKITMVGTRGRIESNQKSRGLQIIIDGNCAEEPNPDFCRSYSADNGLKEWRGYGIESIVNFLNDVYGLNQGTVNLDYLSQIRPTFSVGLVSTAVIEAAHQSLLDGNAWKNVPLVR